MILKANTFFFPPAESARMSLCGKFLFELNIFFINNIFTSCHITWVSITRLCFAILKLLLLFLSCTGHHGSTHSLGQPSGHFHPGGLSPPEMCCIFLQEALHWLRVGCASQAWSAFTSQNRDSTWQLLSEEQRQWQKTQSLPRKVGNVPQCKSWQCSAPKYQVWSGWETHF